MQLKNRTAVVTGAGSGLGRAIAQMLATRGAAVAVTDIDSPSAAEAAHAITVGGGRARAGKLDINQATDIDLVVSAAVRELGPLDIMVNNAGILDGYFNADEMEESTFRHVLDIDLVGMFLCAKLALREMPPRGSERIINMASVAGLSGTGGDTRHAGRYRRCRLFSGFR